MANAVPILWLANSLVVLAPNFSTLLHCENAETPPLIAPDAFFPPVLNFFLWINPSNLVLNYIEKLWCHLHSRGKKSCLKSCLTSLT